VTRPELPDASLPIPISNGKMPFKVAIIDGIKGIGKAINNKSIKEEKRNEKVIRRDRHRQ
jgi:hypothetical protein